MEVYTSTGSIRQGFILLVALLALAAGAKAVLYDTLDPDLFWHLRVADELSVQRFPGPLVDDLAFASVKTPWTPYSWLAELGTKRIWEIGGYRAVVAVQAVLAVALVVLIAMIAMEGTIAVYGRPRYLASAVAAFVGEFLSLPYLSFRPVMIALVLLAGIAWLLVRDRRLAGKSRAVWLVIPATVVMVNIHLYAVFVPLFVFCLMAGEKVKRNRLAILLLGTSLACLCTPMLPGVVAAEWNYQFRDLMIRYRMIAEMQPFYRGRFGSIAAGMAIAVVVAAIVRRKTLGVGQWLWLAMSCVLLLRLGRFATVFAIFGVPTLAVTAPLLRDGVLGRVWLRPVLAALLVVGVGRVCLAFPSGRTPMEAWVNRLGPDCPGYPTAAAEFVRDHVATRTHRVISEFTWGGYLEWRLGTNWQVLMDGRTQVFSKAFWQVVYIGPEDIRKLYLGWVNADVAVLPASGSDFRQDLLDLGWTTIYSDDRAVVMRAPEKKAQNHIVAAY